MRRREKVKPFITLAIIGHLLSAWRRRRETKVTPNHINEEKGTIMNEEAVTDGGASPKYEVRDTTAVVVLGPATIAPLHVIAGEAGVVAYGLRERLDEIVAVLNVSGTEPVLPVSQLGDFVRFMLEHALIDVPERALVEYLRSDD